MEDQLLQAIADDLDAIEPRLVFADWLQTCGDPRGELAIVEHQLATRPWDHTLRSQSWTLQQPLEQSVLDGMDRNILRAWRLGFVDALTLTRQVILHACERPGWIAHPLLRFVRDLFVASSHPRGWDVIERWPHRANVRAFRYGSIQKALAPEVAHNIARLLPALTSLHLTGLRVPPLEPIAALPIVALRLGVERFDPTCARRLLDIPCRLSRLSVRAGAIEGGIATIEPLLTGERLASVRHLELTGVPPLAVVARLVSSGRLRTLETLSLDFQGLPPEQLAGFRDALANVRIESPQPVKGIDVARRTWLAALLDETLGRSTDALAILDELYQFPVHDLGAVRTFGRALHRSGDRGRTRAGFDRMLRNHNWHYATPSYDIAVVALADTLLAYETEPWLVEMRARALAILGRSVEAISGIAAAPPTDTAHVVRWLAASKLDDPVVAQHALAELARSPRAGYAALASLLDGSFEQRWPASCIAPDDVIAAIASPTCSAPVDASDRLDCLEVAIVAAVRAGDRALAAARTHAAAPAFSDEQQRPIHHDFRAAFATLPLDQRMQVFVTNLYCATRHCLAGTSIVALARRYLESDAW